MQVEWRKKQENILKSYDAYAENPSKVDSNTESTWDQLECKSIPRGEFTRVNMLSHAIWFDTRNLHQTKYPSGGRQDRKNCIRQIETVCAMFMDEILFDFRVIKIVFSWRAV